MIKFLNSTLFLLLSSLFFLSSCSGPQSPDFTGLQNLKISKTSGKSLRVDAIAHYHNPNPMGGTLEEVILDIKIDGVDITTIEQRSSVEIPANSDFSIPVTFDFDPNDLTGNKGILKDMLKKVLKNELEVSYDGYTTIALIGQSFKVPVKYTEKMSLGLNYESD